MKLHVLGNEFPVDELSVGSNRPDKSPEDQPRGKRNINNDLLLRGLLLLSNGDQVAPSYPPDPSSNVQEEQARRDELSPVSLISTHNQMRKTV